MGRSSVSKLGMLTTDQMEALYRLTGRSFAHGWMLDEELARQSSQWRPRDPVPANAVYNKELRAKLDFLHQVFRAP